MSYQTSTTNINSFFKNAHSHLKQNGILIFDFWFKDGVLKLQTPVRVREFNNNSYKIVRVTISKWFKKIDQISDIHNLVVLNKKNKKISKFSETHKMKYFEMSFIKKKLKEHNFKFIKSLDLQTGRKISSKSWGAMVVAKKL